MTEILIAIIAAVVSGLSLHLGRLWGRAEGRSIEREQLKDEVDARTSQRVDNGRAALGAGRAAGDPAERLRQNDGRW